MKPVSAAACVVLLVTVSILCPAQRAVKPARLLRSAESTAWSRNEIDVNRVHVPFTNKGGVDNAVNWSSWVNGWGVGESSYFVFDQGLCVTGKRNGVLGGLPYIWESPFSPGPVINGRSALGARPQDSLRYRTYSITRGESADINPDVAAWPADLGAPVDQTNKPRLSGDQTVWMVYNGLDSTTRRNWNYLRTPVPQFVLPLEIRQTVFSHFGEATDTSVWANTVFFEWAIYNRGTDLLDSVYLSLWTDLDLINTYYDIPGVDTLGQTGYCWYSPDSTYGAAGYTLLYGPVVPSPGENAVFFGKNKPGYKNLRLSSFWPIRDDSYADGSSYGPPYSLKTAWNVVRGLTPGGGPIIDSVVTQRQTKFPYSGDPLTHQGWVSSWGVTGGGAGFMMTAGPCTIAPGDSQWIMIALHPSMKVNGIDAITRLRMDASYLRSLQYDSLVVVKPRRAVPTKPLPVFAIPQSFALRQNYPNPFNNATTIPFDLPEKSRVHLEVVNVLGQTVATLADDVLERGYRTISWYPMQSSGIYFVRLTAESVESPSRWEGIGKIAFVK